MSDDSFLISLWDSCLPVDTDTYAMELANLQQLLVIFTVDVGH